MEAVITVPAPLRENFSFPACAGTLAISLEAANVRRKRERVDS